MDLKCWFWFVFLFFLMSSVPSTSFLIAKHRKFLDRCLKVLPAAYSSLDANRLTLLFFALSSLDVLDELCETIVDEERRKIIGWIYSLQLTTESGASDGHCGFRGSFAAASAGQSSSGPYDGGHLAQTYSALCCLLMLGDDLSQVDKPGIIAGLRACQLPDGSFCAHAGGSENDMRFVFCAAAISFIIDDFSGICTKSVMDFIGKSVNYDGGIGQGPGLESHGGSTFCAVSTLCLLNRLWDKSVLSTAQIERLRRWCLRKQEVGFHGRANKPDDSCYAFWVGASLSLLGASAFIDHEKLREFVLSTQDATVGGFSKYADSHPDALHTYFSLAGLSLLHEPGLAPMFAALNTTARTASRVGQLRADLQSSSV